MGCLLGVDEAGEKMEAKRLKRAAEEEKRKRKHAIESKQQFATGQLSGDDSSSPTVSASEDDVVTAKAPKSRKVIRKQFYTSRFIKKAIK